MTTPDKIEKITKIDKAIQEVESGRPEGVHPHKDVFDSLMRQEAAKKVVPTAESQITKPSPMEEATKTHHVLDTSKRASHRELIAQLDSTINQIDQVKNKLGTQDLDLKNSVQDLMRKKLLHIDETLKSALARVGKTEPTAAVGELSGAEKVINPIHRFLGLLSEGQSKLYSLSGSITDYASRKEMSPASLLAIQIKVGMVQQQIELFTALLNKALESTKTIMNVQI